MIPILASDDLMAVSTGVDFVLDGIDLCCFQRAFDYAYALHGVGGTFRHWEIPHRDGVASITKIWLFLIIII